MDIGILAVDDVLNDGVKRRFAKLMTIDAAAHMTERIERTRVGDDDAVAILELQPAPGRLGEGSLVMGDEVAGRMIERRDYLPGTAAKQDARVRDEALGAADAAVLVHEDDRLVVGVESEPAGAQTVVRSRTRCSFGGGNISHDS